MIENLLFFVLTSALLVISPGVDSLFVINSSLIKGAKSGKISAFGISIGILIHTLFACLGLSALIVASTKVFTVIKYIGAAYLILLGIIAIVKKVKKDNQEIPNGLQNFENDRSLFLKAILTNVLNPKVALFFLAFFPQFVNLKAGDNKFAFFILGLIYFILTLLWLLVLANFSAKISEKVNRSEVAQKIINRVTGVVFVLMGFKVLQ